MVSSTAFVVMARKAERGTVSDREERIFRAFNTLSPSLRAPVWLVMQAGSFGAIPVSAAIAFPRHRRTSLSLALGGTAAWSLCKLVKRVVKRGRPADHLTEPVVHGNAQRGSGFPSGHAAVATTLAAIVSCVLPRRAARIVWGVPVVVCCARQYVGAHLPLDVAGGAALGLSVGTIANLVELSV